jgi:hypothetical protein
MLLPNARNVLDQHHARTQEAEERYLRNHQYLRQLPSITPLVQWQATLTFWRQHRAARRERGAATDRRLQMGAD